MKKNYSIVYDKLFTFGGGERVLKILIEILKPTHLVTLNVYDLPFWTKYLNFKKFITPRFGFIFFNRSFYFLLYPLSLYLISRIKPKTDVAFYYTSSCGLYANIYAKTKILYLNYPSRGIYEPEKLIHNKVLLFLIKFSIALFNLKKINKRQYLKFDKIYTISISAQQALKKYTGLDSVVITPPISLTPRIKLSNINLSNTKFLVVSRLEPEKNIQSVYNFFNRSKLSLTIAGKGSLLNSFLSERKNVNLKILGFISDEMLFNLYKKHDVLIFPSDIEYGLSVLEAISAGIPVIAIDSPFTREYLSDSGTYKNCIYYDPNLQGSLEFAIKKFKSFQWNPVLIRKSSARFSINEFKGNIKKIL